MTNDIKKAIEEEARQIEYKQEIDLYSDLYEGVVSYEYAYDLMESLKIEAYKNGYNKALHSSRWRKVEEGEYPEENKDVLVRITHNGYTYHLVDRYIYHEWQEIYLEGSIIEWKPIH